MSESQAQPPAKTTTITRSVSPSALKALQTGDNSALIRAFGIDISTMPEATALAIRNLAELPMEIRRGSVATLGNYEAFVRHTEKGSLHQVIRPVRLSTGDKTLYQIPVRKPFKRGTDEIAPRGWDKRDTDWREVAQPSAEITHHGLLKLNAVVGASVGLPPSVMVDGQERTNPYVERAQAANGRLGDIVRVIVAVVVVAPVPMTGNPCAVNYTLDYDPAKDLQFMLAEIADKQAENGGSHERDVYLIDEDEWATARKPGWKFVPVFGGVGYAVNLRHALVAEAYAKHINMLQNAVKKAQTVARRNAMKAHPALAFHTVEVDNRGTATIAVTGWAGDESAMRHWQDIQNRLLRGLTLPKDTQVIDVEQAYDPAAEKAADVSTGGEGERVQKESQRDDAHGGIDPELEARNNLIEQIDFGVGLLSPSQVAALNYDPKTNDTERLRAILTEVNALVDSNS